MKIIIDIDKDYYEIIKHDVNNGMNYLPCVLIANGTPLDRIIDKIEIHRRKTEAIDQYDLVGDCLDIIEMCVEEEK